MQAHWQHVQKLETLAANTRDMLTLLDDMLTFGSWRCTQHPDGNPIPLDKQHWKGGCEVMRRADGLWTIITYGLSNSGKTRHGERELFAIRPREYNSVNSRAQNAEPKRFTFTIGGKSEDVTLTELREAISFAVKFSGESNYLKDAA
jgi:hypothetical protein